MVEVVLWGNLKPYADGLGKVEVDAHTTGQLYERLAEAYPGLAPLIESGVSVSINGRVIASSLAEPIPEGAEVVLLPQLKGG